MFRFATLAALTLICIAAAHADGRANQCATADDQLGNLTTVQMACYCKCLQHCEAIATPPPTADTVDIMALPYIALYRQMLLILRENICLGHQPRYDISRVCIC